MEEEGGTSNRAKGMGSCVLVEGMVWLWRGEGQFIHSTRSENRTYVFIWEVGGWLGARRGSLLHVPPFQLNKKQGQKLKVRMQMEGLQA